MSVMLQKRPLLDSAAEQSLFVSDASRSLAVDRGASSSGNSLVVGEPGSGKTSILFAVLARCRDHASYLNAATLGHPMEIVRALTGVLTDLEAVEPDRMSHDAADPLAEAREVRRWRTADPRTRLLVDDINIQQAARLFGQLRDELWQTPVKFTVAARPEVAAVLDAPPADAFFDSRMVLEPLQLDAARELLKLRKAFSSAANKRLSREGVALQPRQVIALADEGASSAAGLTPARQHRALTVAEEVGGRSAAMLLSELWGREGATAAELATAVGLSRQRVVLLLRMLEQHGLLAAYTAPRTGRPGRPERLYTVVAG